MKTYSRAEIFSINYSKNAQNNKRISENSFCGIQKTIGFSKQSKNIADCWLLSAINSLSYSKIGAKLLQNSIKTENNCFITNFLGIDKTYTISKYEIANSFQSGLYSQGDIDLLLFEIAIQKIRNDIFHKHIVFPNNYPHYIKNSGDNASGFNLDYGWSAQVFYIISGKFSVITGDMLTINKLLKIYEEDKERYALSCNFTEDFTALGTDFYEFHEYAIKRKENNVLIVTNPWNSYYELHLPVEELWKKGYLTMCKLE